MKTLAGHLSYCTNIHPGETWSDHFAELKKNIPVIKTQVSPDSMFGIGLRLSHSAVVELSQSDNLHTFRQWLSDNDAYVFTMNGFPYGGFHHAIVKDHVHRPDWTTQDRVDYTSQLFTVFSELLPEGMQGGISTSPLSYKHWHTSSSIKHVLECATLNVLKVVNALVQLEATTGKTFHLDIEPEPDGMLETGEEFINWYQEYLLPQGEAYLKNKQGFSTSQSHEAIRKHVHLCYDICHFAVGFENHVEVIQRLDAAAIKIGKIQISAALRGAIDPLSGKRQNVVEAFRHFNEPTYLHQVVALQQDGSLKRYPDLPQALADALNDRTREWRAHYHVPLFTDRYDVLQSTQEDILTVLNIHKQKPLTDHLEVETYTWDVLPSVLKSPITDSIIRELHWTRKVLAL